MNEIKDLLDNLKAKLDKEKEMQKQVQESADDLKEKIRLAREQAQSVSNINIHFMCDLHLLCTCLFFGSVFK